MCIDSYLDVPNGTTTQKSRVGDTFPYNYGMYNQAKPQQANSNKISQITKQCFETAQLSEE